MWIEEVKEELVRARARYPNPNLLTTAMAEESGEAIKAILDHMSHKGCLTQVKHELIQTIAMCVRLLEEGDPIHKLPPSIALHPGACQYKRRSEDE